MAKLAAACLVSRLFAVMPLERNCWPRVEAMMMYTVKPTYATHMLFFSCNLSMKFASLVLVSRTTGYSGLLDNVYSIR